MSQHPSLKEDSVGVKHRNVLTRIERVKKLQSLNKWDDAKSIFGLPKVKSVKIKVKKTKEAPAEGVEAATAPGAVATPAKPGAPVAPKAAAAPPKAAAAAPKAAAPAKQEKKK